MSSPRQNNVDPDDVDRADPIDDFISVASPSLFQTDDEDADDEGANNDLVSLAEDNQARHFPPVLESPDLNLPGQGNARSESAESDSPRSRVFDVENSRSNSVALSEDSLFVDQDSPLGENLRENQPDAGRLDQTLDRARALRAQWEGLRQSGERAQAALPPLGGHRRRGGEDELVEMEIAGPRRRGNRNRDRNPGPARPPANAAVIDLTAEDEGTDDDVVIISSSRTNSRGNSRTSRNPRRGGNQSRNRTPAIIDLTNDDDQDNIANMDNIDDGMDDPYGFQPGGYFHDLGAPAAGYGAFNNNAGVNYGGPANGPAIGFGDIDNHDIDNRNHAGHPADVNFGPPVGFLAGHNGFVGGNLPPPAARPNNNNRDNDRPANNILHMARIPHHLRRRQVGPGPIIEDRAGIQGVGNAINPIELLEDDEEEDGVSLDDDDEDDDILMVEHPVGNHLVGIVRNVLMNGFQAFGGLLGRVNVEEHNLARTRTHRFRHGPPNMPPIANPHNPLAQNFPNFNYQANGYNNRNDNNNVYKAPSPAPEGFTMSSLDEEGEDVAICAGCDEELAYEEGSTPKERPAKRQRPNGKPSQKKQIHFWFIKECGHAYCNKCYQGRNSKGETVFPVAPPGNGRGIRPHCAVEGCKADAHGSSAWQGIYAS